MPEARHAKKPVSARPAAAVGDRPTAGPPEWSAAGSSTAGANVAASPTQCWEKYRECRLRQFASWR